LSGNILPVSVIAVKLQLLYFLSLKTILGWNFRSSIEVKFCAANA